MMRFTTKLSVNVVLISYTYQLKTSPVQTSICKVLHKICLYAFLGSCAGGSPRQVTMEEVPEQARGSDVNLEPQPATSNGDASTQEGQPTMDNELATSSSTLVPERSQKTQKYEEEETVTNPFLLTASYLLDVHASKVGVANIFLN